MTGLAAMATVLFTDVVGSTALRVALGEEHADELRRAHDRMLGQCVLAQDGVVVKGGGDGLLAAFTSASAGLSAAVEMQRAVAAYNRRADRLAELSVRIGLSAGDVSWEDGDCFGTPVVEAARLQAAAGGGQILCSDLVRLMARGRGGHELVPFGELDLKGLVEPVRAFDVRWAAADTRPGLPLPANLVVAASAPFVGRRGELAEVRAQLVDIDRVAPTVVWLAGEAGIGKTRLAAEVAGELHAAGWAVLFGRCDEALQLPYQPFAEALRFLCGHIEDAQLANVMGGASAPELVRLCPDLEHRLPGGRQLLSGDPRDQEQYRLFEAVRNWFATMATDRPVLMVLDDAHWATGPTLLLLNYLARTLEAGRVAFITTLRHTECPAELRAIIDESELRPGGLELRLAGLGRQDVALLAGPGMASEALYTRTAGNPLFVRTLVASGEHSTTLDAAIRRRVSRLPASTQDLLLLACIAGVEFDVRVLAEAKRGTVEDLLVDIEAGVTAGLLEEADPNRLRFAHGLVREALHDQLGGTRRLLGNRALAEAYERIRPDDVAALARHWSEAVSDAESARAALSALRRAGDVAEAASDHDGAARAFARALELAPSEDLATRAHLSLALGRARVDGGSYTAATERLLLDAAALAAELGLDEVVVDATIRACLIGGFLGRVSEAAVRALASLRVDEGRDPVLAARVRALQANMYGWIGDNARAVTAGLDVLAEAEATGDARAIGWARLAVVMSLPYERSREKVHHSRASFAGRESELADTFSIFGRIHLVSALLAVGDLPAMAAQLVIAAAQAERRRDPFLQHIVEVGSSTVALLRGDFPGAEAAVARAEGLAARIEGVDISGIHGLQMFSIRREQGRLVEIAPTMRLVAKLDDGGAWRPGLAAVYAELGMRAEAERELDRIIVGQLVDLPDDSRRPLSMSYLADAVGVVGDPGKAATLYELMAGWSGLTIAAFVIACSGPVDRFLGMLALTMGDLDRAQVHLQAALEQCLAMGSPTYEAHTRYWLGRLAAARGSAGEAQHRMVEVAELAGRLGMAGLLARAAAQGS